MVQRRGPRQNWAEGVARNISEVLMYVSFAVFFSLHPISKGVIRASGSLTSGIFAPLKAQSMCVWGKGSPS